MTSLKSATRRAVTLVTLVTLAFSGNPSRGERELERFEASRSEMALAGLVDASAPLVADAPGPRRYAQLMLDLDIQLVPEGAPFFSARFSHAEHTRWDNCSSCHPGVLSQRHRGMKEIFAGQSCGSCHGSSAFSVETNCWRCHINFNQPLKADAEVDFTEARKTAVPSSPQILQAGEGMFERMCADCHGSNGDGTGPLAAYLNPKPRDFADQNASYFAPDGELNLYRTLTMGVTGTGMPPWSSLSSRDRWALVHYVKSLSQSRNR